MTEKSLSKWEQAISKLVEFTQDGKLEWEIVNPNDYLPKDDTTGAMLIVHYDDKYLLLYKRAYMREIGGIFSALSVAEPKQVKDYSPKLSVYDMTAKVVIYTFPYSDLIGDLYKAATFSAAKIEDLISKILAENSTEPKPAKQD